MTALGKMIDARDGLKNIAWGGMLHMMISLYATFSLHETTNVLSTSINFDSRQDLSYMSMTAEASHQGLTPHRLLIRGM